MTRMQGPTNRRSSVLKRTLNRIALAVVLEAAVSSSFLAPTAPTILRQHASKHTRPEYTAVSRLHHVPRTIATTPVPPSSSSAAAASSSTTALSVWWFGGTDSAESVVTGDDDSCELVAVRIERPSSNSRKIFGEIFAPVPLEDVWAILTDYDRLRIHVPNLVESNIVSRPSLGEQGDGTFRCRLFQKGAQKIIGFEFGASVTMDMQEIINSEPSAAHVPVNGLTGHERSIQFKCYDSFFFKNFDGYWRVTERIGENGEPESLISYVVDVRPKGPVPVAALEWRIREDVPTNLRAVKKAAMEVGREGVLASRGQRSTMKVARSSRQTASNGAANGQQSRRRSKPQRGMSKVKVLWEESETMAAYLKN